MDVLKNESNNELRSFIRKHMSELNDSLMHSVRSLKEVLPEDIRASTKSTHENIRTSVISIHVALKLVERVKQVFSNSRQFWAAVEYSFDSLPSSPIVEQLCDDDIFGDQREALFLLEIRASVVGWLVTGNWSRMSSQQMRDVSNDLNRTIPVFMRADECVKFIEEISTKLLSDISEEDGRLNDLNVACLYEILMAQVKDPPLETKEDESKTEIQREDSVFVDDRSFLGNNDLIKKDDGENQTSSPEENSSNREIIPIIITDEATNDNNDKGVAGDVTAKDTSSVDSDAWKDRCVQNFRFFLH